MFFVPSTRHHRPKPVTDKPSSLDVALAREALADDRLRAMVLAAVLASIAAAYLSFCVLFRSVNVDLWHGRLSVAMLSCVFLPAVVFELLLCGLLAYYQRKGVTPSLVLTYATALAETSFPTAVLLVLSHAMDPLVALTLAATHLYYFFILLATLRLTPRLCVFTGLVAAIEYMALAVTFELKAPAADGINLTNMPLHMWKATLYALAGAVAAFVASQIRKQVASALQSLEKEKHVRDVFGKHVSPQVVDQLLRQDVAADGEVRHVCVMFLDIRDFTARSSKLQPEDVVAYLNMLFDFMIECVNRHGGIVNKFLGDGFMAVFGAPISDGCDSQNAVAAAREILERVEAVNAFGDGEPTRVGIGLHTGPVLAGTVGSTLRKEYTIIGDTVNLASRIEGLNKQFGSCLLISEEVWREIGCAENCACALGPVAVKGKADPVNVYRLA